MPRSSSLYRSSPTSSGASTPTTTTTTSSSTLPPSAAHSSYLPSTVSYAVSGLLRRFSSTTDVQSVPSSQTNNNNNNRSSSIHPTKSPMTHSSFSPSSGARPGIDGVYTPPQRHASPFQPPPLYPITLRGYGSGTAASAQLLSRALAEEIRLLVPARLQLCEEWNLVYSLDQDGVSLGTLYKKCDELRGRRNGFVLVVRDGEGGLFGAYMTDAPHPNPHYFGTGECFLWHASFLTLRPPQTSSNNNNNNSSNKSNAASSSSASKPKPDPDFDPNEDLISFLPPPPSADTTNLQRSTTIGGPSPSSSSFSTASSRTHPAAPGHPANASHGLAPPPPDEEQRIRFKAFPYSGVNDYLMFCESGFLSIGGGDGHYGLWLDDSLERGVSSGCPTFGNEPLSDEGEKFEIMGVEVWTLGNI